MSEHQLTEAFFRDLRTATLVRAVPLAFVAVAVGIFIGSRGATDSRVTLGVAGILLILLGVGLANGFRRQSKALRTFRISFDDTTLSRTQDGVPDLQMPLTEVRKLLETPKALIVVGNSPHRVIGIPRTLEGFSDVERPLKALPVAAESPRAYNLTMPAALAVVIAFGVVFTASNPAIVASIGLALALALVLSAVLTLTDPRYDKRIKAVAWLTLLPLLAIGFKIWNAFQLL